MVGLQDEVNTSTTATYYHCYYYYNCYSSLSLMTTSPLFTHTLLPRRNLVVRVIFWQSNLVDGDFLLDNNYIAP